MENKKEKTRKSQLRTRGGQELTVDQVRRIKEGRKQIKKQLKQAKAYSKKEYELTCSSMGLYFDKIKLLTIPMWFLHGRGLASVLIAGGVLLATVFLSSLVTQMKGQFTVNLTDDMFQSGFMLSEDANFTGATSTLYGQMAENVPCVSLISIPKDVDQYDGSHNDAAYFAYTFYVGYEGKQDEEIAYSYELKVNSESNNLSTAVWAMLFVDGKMTIYAEMGQDGKPEALPARDDNTRGYRNLQLVDLAANPQQQFEVILSKGSDNYYRVITEPFLSDEVLVRGTREGVNDGDVHKYTLVLWLEGDDPQCTDNLIGGHLGVELSMQLLDTEDESNEDGYSLKEAFRDIWESLKFWGE